MKRQHLKKLLCFGYNKYLIISNEKLRVCFHPQMQVKIATEKKTIWAKMKRSRRLGENGFKFYYRNKVYTENGENLCRNSMEQLQPKYSPANRRIQNSISTVKNNKSQNNKCYKLLCQISFVADSRLYRRQCYRHS